MLPHDRSGPRCKEDAGLNCPRRLALGGQTANPRARRLHLIDLCGAALSGAVAWPLANRRMISQALRAAEGRRCLARPSCNTELLLRNTTSKTYLLVRDYEGVSA